MLRTRPRKLLLGLILAAAAGCYLLITPGNPISRLLRGKFATATARVIVGPYPLEDDFRILKAHNVNVVVTLLSPDLPYEELLLRREMDNAKKYGIRVLTFPMASVVGLGFGPYRRTAEEAAEAIAREPGKVYVHCYLGLHRTKLVEKLLRERQMPTGTYLLRQATRSEEAKLTDRAQTLYYEGRYREALVTLRKIRAPAVRSRLVEGWANYKLGQIAVARGIFEAVLRAVPNTTEAENGLGYSALRQDDLSVAEREFQAVMNRERDNAPALIGMGFVRYRQGRSGEAATLLSRGLKFDPGNQEARQILEKVQGRS